VLTNILYIWENKEKQPTLYFFDEFQITIEAKNIRLKKFFDELYFSSNPSFKNKDSQTQVKKQLLFVCYFLCEIQNKFINDAKRNLTIYINSTDASNTSIDTLTDLQ